MPGYENQPFPEIQKGYIDSLAHPEKCLPDIELLKELNVNTIRVYQIDPDQSHETCMHALARNGIYVLVDLLEPKNAINRNDPSWHTELFQHFQAVIDNMHRYDNVLGFIAGNEVVTSSSDALAAAYVKAAIRDSKAYQRQKGYRQIPIGYTANDDEETRKEALQYFQCPSNSTDSVADFYGINMFEWCGYSTFATSGFRARTREFSQLAVPVFLSEFGCNSVRPRPFTETELLYGPEMAGVWLGGVAYEFFENENHYGLVFEEKTGRLQKLAEFDTLRLRFTAARPPRAENTAWGGKKTAPVCPKWPVLADLPGTPNDEICGCLGELVTCKPKLEPSEFDSPELSKENQALFKKVCEVVDCSAVTGDGGSGKYGQFSGCAPVTRLAWALLKAEADGVECDFGGKAERLGGVRGLEKCKGIDFFGKRKGESREGGSLTVASTSVSVSLGESISQPLARQVNLTNGTKVGFHLNGAQKVAPSSWWGLFLMVL